MGKIVDRLKSDEILISDGAWGTFLHEKGLGASDCPELWNTERPDDVLDIAQSYIVAGAHMIETNSFGGSPIKLGHYGLESRAYELNKAAAEISRIAAGENHYVLGSVGPTGKVLMMGEVDAETMLDGFRIQTKALAEGGADAIMIETMSDLEEVKLAVQAAQETACEVFCTMTFNRGGDGSYHTMMGVEPKTMVEQLVEIGVELIGTNCGNGFANMIEIVQQIREVNSDIPILVHANAGLPIYQEGKTVFPETPEEMAALVPQLIHAGVNVIGGCCGTTPKHIEKIARAVTGQ